MADKRSIVGDLGRLNHLYERASAHARYRAQFKQCKRRLRDAVSHAVYNGKMQGFVQGGYILQLTRSQLRA